MINCKVYASKALVALVVAAFATTPATEGCPIAGLIGSQSGMPSEHPNLSSLRGAGEQRVASSSYIGDNEASRERIAAVLANRRALHPVDEGCFTQAVFDHIVQDVADLADALNSTEDKGHFLGGIVRLAAHDFMDYDQSDTSNLWGMDGCIEASAPDNAGLETIWCDDCPLTNLYNSGYQSVVGRADFWVAAANAVVQITSKNWTDSGDVFHDQLVLPFRYGRTDNDDCIGSAERLPGAQGCDEVERTMLNQMGLSWREAVALLGAHTLGFGSSDFSGHEGMWMDVLEESVVFDKRYYEELLRRSWRVRNNETDIQDYTWAGNNGGNPRFMLNVDVCLAFDIDNDKTCCTSIRDQNDPDGIPPEAFCLPPGADASLHDTVVECDSSIDVRPEARGAVDDFAVSTRTRDSENNDPFYQAFAAAWQKATELGYPEGSLQELPLTCGPTTTPTQAPTGSPTGVPTSSPTDAPSSRPSGPGGCQDVGEFDVNGRTRDCQWVLSRDRCNSFGQDFCPESCHMCDCAPRGSSCSTDDDCCLENICNDRNTCRPPLTT